MLLQLTLNEKLKKIRTLDSEVFELIDDDTLDDEIQQANDCKENVFNTLIRIDRIMKAAPTSSSPTEAPPTEMEPHPLTPIRAAYDFRSFNGDQMKWTSFWESFESAVHSKNTLSNIENLTSLLERSAREVVSGLALTAANHHKTIDTQEKVRMQTTDSEQAVIAPPSRKLKPESRHSLNTEGVSCLRKGHLSRDCRSTNCCRTCRGSLIQASVVVQFSHKAQVIAPCHKEWDSTSCDTTEPECSQHPSIYFTTCIYVTVH